MENNNHSHYVPHFITAKDIAIIENCTIPEAQGRYKRMRKKWNVKRGEKFLTENYCRERGTTPTAITKFFTRRFVTVLLATVTITLTFVCCRIIIRNYFPELNNFIKKHFIYWDYVSPTHAHGYYQMKSPVTGKMETITIDAKRLHKDQIPPFLQHYYDTARSANATPLNNKR